MHCGQVTSKVAEVVGQKVVIVISLNLVDNKNQMCSTTIANLIPKNIKFHQEPTCVKTSHSESQSNQIYLMGLRLSHRIAANKVDKRKRLAER